MVVISRVSTYGVQSTSLKLANDAVQIQIALKTNSNNSKHKIYWNVMMEIAILSVNIYAHYFQSDSG